MKVRASGPQSAPVKSSGTSLKFTGVESTNTNITVIQSTAVTVTEMTSGWVFASRTFVVAVSTSERDGLQPEIVQAADDVLTLGVPQSALSALLLLVDQMFLSRGDVCHRLDKCLCGQDRCTSV